MSKIYKLYQKVECVNGSEWVKINVHLQEKAIINIAKSYLAKFPNAILSLLCVEETEIKIDLQSKEGKQE
jgi:hypothetical protein